MTLVKQIHVQAYKKAIEMWEREIKQGLHARLTRQEILYVYRTSMQLVGRIPLEIAWRLFQPHWHNYTDTV